MIGFLCPVCRQPLPRGTPPWKCVKGHSFDVAREGYVNLLLAQEKSSRDPGDSAEMIRARAAFLQAGHYAPLREAVSAMLAAIAPASLLDLGCGEGYYTQALATVAQETVGLDISKPAIQHAAKRNRNVTWIVASGAHLPLADGMLDAITCLFTPLHVAEMQRTLRPGGHVIVVTPAPEHLWTLRERLFDEVQAHLPDKFLPAFNDGFEFCEKEDVRFPLHLAQPDLQRLLMMTPYAWKAKLDRRKAVEQLPGLDTAAAFRLMLLRRH